MSSTNRGHNRQGNDFYGTPAYTIQSLLDVHEIGYPVLEPCAGNLAIVRALGGCDEHVIYTNDINPDAPTQTHQDYRTLTIYPHHWIETIVTNPPFNIAQEIIEKALVDVVDGGEVIMLLRLNFLGSQKRKAFWDSAPLKHIYILSKRPSFTKDGKTDSIEYMWAVFERGYTGKATIEVI